MSTANKHSFNAAHGLVDQHVLDGYGSRVALLQSGAASVTYAALQQESARMATFLRELAVSPGQRVALLLNDRQEFVFAFISILKLGAVAIPLNTFSTADNLEFYLSDSQADVLLTEADYRDTVEQVSRATLGQLNNIVYLDGADWSDAPSKLDVHSTTPEDQAFWLYTSGSTGCPKAVIHRHGGIRHCADSFGRSVLGLARSDRCFSTSKLFFAYGLGNSLLMPLTAGASVILNSGRTDHKTICDVIKTHQPTLFFSVPTLYRRLIADDRVSKSMFANVRMCISAGEYLPGSVFADWKKATGRELVDGIGSTEAMHIFCSNRTGNCRPGTSGHTVDGYELRIVDDAGNDVDEGRIGQLLVRGGSVSTNYWNRPDATQKVFLPDGWLRTGDLYRQDADGFFVYEGRRDDAFKSSGLWVSPVEIEQALLAKDEVEEAAVIACKNGHGLVGPKAFITPATRLSIDQQGDLVQRLRDELSEQLPKHKVPHVIEIVADLPRTATGKVARRLLRDATLQR